MKKILKLTFILLLVSAVVAGVLGGVFILTDDQIKANNAETTRLAYEAVLPDGISVDPLSGKDVKETVKVSDANIKILKCTPADDGNIYVVEAEATGSQGKITIAIGVDKANGTCTGISIIASSETSGLGAEASKPYFKERLVDSDANSCLITKEGGSVEAITGATITSKAVTRSVSAAIKYVTNMG